MRGRSTCWSLRDSVSIESCGAPRPLMSSLYSEVGEILVKPPGRGDRRLTHQLTNVTHECGAIDLARPERGEVPGRHLAVDQLKAPSRELARQQHERDL